MKFNRIITLCAMATALTLSAGTSFAQQNGNGNNGGGGGRGNRGNFDPAQFQQRMMDNVRDQLGFTNDTDWNAVQPLVQKVMDAQRDARGNQMRGMFGRGRGNRGNRGGQNADQANQNRGNRGGFFGQTSPERDALQKALDDNAPSSQIKDLLAKYRASQKANQEKLESAQSDLKKVLSTKQEAEAALMGLVD